MDFVENRENREYAETIIELGKIGAYSFSPPISLMPTWGTSFAIANYKNATN